MSYPPSDIVESDDISPEDLRRLTALLERYDLTELRYEQGDVRVTLRTGVYFRQQSGAIAVPLQHGIVTDSQTDEHDDVSDAFPESTPVSPGVQIEAPIMGVFYRAVSPADPPFVEVGDHVEVGQAIGLIEAMKVFSEIKSEVSGTVREIPVTNKALVQPGDTLVILDVD